MIRVLFICHGNICRSPMAEFVMKDLVKKAGGNRQPCLSPGPPKAEGARYRLYRQNGPTAHPGRL